MNYWFTNISLHPWWIGRVYKLFQIIQWHNSETEAIRIDEKDGYLVIEIVQNGKRKVFRSYYNLSQLKQNNFKPSETYFVLQEESELEK